MYICDVWHRKADIQDLNQSNFGGPWKELLGYEDTFLFVYLCWQKNWICERKKNQFEKLPETDFWNSGAQEWMRDLNSRNIWTVAPETKNSVPCKGKTPR
jgi:hypothetical protein